MNRETKKIFVVFFMAFLMFIGCGQKEEIEVEKPSVTKSVTNKGPALKFVVQPCWGPLESFAMFTPLTDYLSKETGLTMELVIVETEKDFHARINEVHFALQDAFSVYIHNKMDAIFDPLVIAVFEDGSVEERGAILVRAASDIKNISDLKGKTFLFGARHNTPKFFAAFITLKKSGIDPDSDLKGYGFGGDCGDNAMSVFLGEHDAGAVCKDFVHGEEGKAKFNFKTDLRVITDTIPVANWMVTASKNIDKETAEKVKKALLKIRPESPVAETILEKTEWGGFLPVTGNELLEIDKLAQEYSVPLVWK